MLQTILFFTVIFLVYAVIEWYGWQAVKTVLTAENHNIAKRIYWGVSIGIVLFFVLYRPVLYHYLPKSFSTYFGAFFVIFLFSKLIILLFLLSEDAVRGARFVISKFSSQSQAGGITRSQFLSQVAVAAAVVPAASLLYGVVVNAYNYQFRKVTLRFPNLPSAFNGFRIVQLSDIHSGSFTRTKPLIDAVEKINQLNADVILFTGDLVNNVADEMESYMDIFGNLKSKHGVFSITGNHDYGDYVHWNSPQDKKANFEKFKATHKNLGWDLMLNENRVLEKDGDKIALIGVENWGSGGHWSKYGKFEKAYSGIEQLPFKVLMSHDPSSWDVKVRPEFPDIDLTLSGHTHGAQFGVENKWLKWSPSQYIYKQWAGLYNEGRQFLYVNRGFGFLGYPGRVGILPEVTEITLMKA